MIKLKTTRKFTHGGETYRPGDTITLRDQRHADALEAKGLVRAAGEHDPEPAKKEPSKPAKKADKAD